jgi:hypothetical protein
MSDLFFSIFRLAYLVLILIFLFSTVLLIRKDVYGSADGKKNSKHGSNSDLRKASASGASESAKIVDGALASLSVVSGPMQGAIFPIMSTEITIGRSKANSFQLLDEFASSKHVKIFTLNGKWYIQDLSSTNGTWLGDKQLIGESKLAFGTPFYIGDSKIILSR